MSEIITLKDQWRLAFAAACDPQLSRADLAVLMIVIDRYFKSKGNSRASFDLLADKAGINRRSVIRSLQRLTSLGYLDVLSKGRRGRATEYLPEFGFDCAAGKSYNRGEKCGDMDVTLTDEKYGDTDVTIKGEKGDADVTETAEYGDTDVTPTYLREPADKAGVRVSRTSERGRCPRRGFAAATWRPGRRGGPAAGPGCWI